MFGEFGNWVKIIGVFLLLVIVPVWVVPISDITFKWKALFTIGGFIGSFVAIEFGTIGRKH